MKSTWEGWGRESDITNYGVHVLRGREEGGGRGEKDTVNCVV